MCQRDAAANRTGVWPSRLDRHRARVVVLDRTVGEDAIVTFHLVQSSLDEYPENLS